MLTALLCCGLELTVEGIALRDQLCDLIVFLGQLILQGAILVLEQDASKLQPSSFFVFDNDTVLMSDILVPRV